MWSGASRILVTLLDASWAGHADEQGKPYYSQGGRLVCLSEPSLLATGRGKAMALSLSSTQLKRVCRSTRQAETQGMAEPEEKEHE